MDRSLATMSHDKQNKKLGRFGLDKNRGEGGSWGNGEGWHCSLGKIMKASSRTRTWIWVPFKEKSSNSNRHSCFLMGKDFLV